MKRKLLDRLCPAEDRPAANTRRERGSALVEAAVVMPFVLVLVLGLVDFGLMINRGTLANNATREAAREAMFGADEAAIEARVIEAASDLDPADLTVTVTCKTPDGSLCIGDYDDEREPGGAVIVHTQYTYHYITPITNLLGLGSTLELQSQIEMRLEG